MAKILNVIGKLQGLALEVIQRGFRGKCPYGILVIFYYGLMQISLYPLAIKSERLRT